MQATQVEQRKGIYKGKLRDFYSLKIVQHMNEAVPSRESVMLQLAESQKEDVQGQN